MSGSPLKSSQRIDALELRDMLAHALGDEKSYEVVTEAAGRLRKSLTSLNTEDAVEILDDLATDSGIIGVAARLARARVTSAANAPESGASPPFSGEYSSGRYVATLISSDAPPPSSTQRSPREQIEAAMAATLGPEKASEVVAEAVATLHMPELLDHTQGAQVLDYLCRSEGLTAVVARFAKARYVLGTPPNSER
jgi:hypothetical protein